MDITNFISTIHGVKIVNFNNINYEGWNLLLKEKLNELNTSIENIINNNDDATFDNTFGILEESLVNLNDMFGSLLCAKANATEDILKLVSIWNPLLAETFANIYQNEKLLEKIKQSHLNGSYLWDDKKLKVYKDAIEQFNKNGCSYELEKKEKIKKLMIEISNLENEFDIINFKNANNTIKVLMGNLNGANTDFLKSLDYEITKYKYALIPVNPSFIDPLLSTVKDRSTREILYKACFNRGLGLTDGDISTQEINEKLLNKRYILAKELGYKSWADYQLNTRMEKDSVKIKELLYDFWERVNDKSYSLIDILQSYVNNELGEDIQLEPWDLDFYLNKFNNRNNKTVNLKEYFPLKRVRQKAFEFASNFFEIEFIEDRTIPVYHEDVIPYLVRDSFSKKEIGILLIDDYSRPTKEAGAWMNVFSTGYSMNKGNRSGVVNVLNIPKNLDDKEELLDYDDVITIFHELGHALHGLLGQTTYPSQSGVNVNQDFVELPSQFFENFASSMENFINISQHWKTGEKIPLDYFENSKIDNNILINNRYLQSAIVDLEIHLMDFKDQNIVSVEKDILKKLNAPIVLNQRHALSHFGHIFSGFYSAGYYSYLWAEILQADISSRFKSFLNIDLKLAREMKKIYSAGGSVEAIDLFVNFQGRGPNYEHLLKKMNILETKMEKRPSI